MNIVKPAANIIPKWTKNGSKLLKKEKFNIERLRYDEIPAGTAVFERVTVATDFGKGCSKVLSFRDKDGKALRKVVIKEKDGKRVSKTIRNYERSKDVLFTDTKHVLTGKTTNETREIFHVKPQADGKKSLTRMKFEGKYQSDGSRLETQVYEDLAPKKVSCEKLKTTAKRLKNGQVIDKTISGDSEIVARVKDDPYLYIRNYGKKDFIRSVSLLAKKYQDVADVAGRLKIQKINGLSHGYYQSFSKTIAIDPHKSGKADLVDTLNHEYRHKWQYKLISKYLGGLLNIFKKDKSVLSKKEKQLAPKLLKADIFYCPPMFSYEKYHANLLEKDARAAGQKAYDEYVENSKKLADLLGVPKSMTFVDGMNEKTAEFIKDAPKVDAGIFNVASE
ncbi:MAG: hypothetical protein SPL73_04655 [Cyanobacteriota bacterium]|nr:hypothetical protein [Cyanobacteriota bacterium]MDY6359073.1 hypothetical protein [Cyanobacteriota bacterium]MDY6364162.1 hypothetical protein [Cyanobacteriota bacterium]MDY6383028.1 hypothetical protein [Cyanobacteriota bacterium]